MNTLQLTQYNGTGNKFSPVVGLQLSNAKVLKTASSMLVLGVAAMLNNSPSQNMYHIFTNTYSNISENHGRGALIMMNDADADTVKIIKARVHSKGSQEHFLRERALDHYAVDHAPLSHKSLNVPSEERRLTAKVKVDGYATHTLRFR